jgi:plastocyanin
MNVTLKSINAKVVGPQESPDAIPLTLHAGDAVMVVRNHPDRAGYVWAEDGQISAGWVPLDLIDLNSGVPRAKAEFCSAELTVAPGDSVRLMWQDAAHGAWWCEDRHSERGWVRSELLEVDEAGGTA